MNMLRFMGYLVCCLVLLSSPVLGEEPGVGMATEVLSSGQTGQALGDGFGEGLFEEKDPYFHPFLSLNTYYTDNLFNDPEDEEDDIVVDVIPGIWVAFPASRQPLLRMSTLNTAPGGLQVSRFKTPSQRKFQGYGLYRANIRRHNDYSDEDTENHHAEGLLQYKFRNEASIEVVNIYERTQDPYSTGTSNELDEYDSNLFNVMGTWPVSPKLAFRADYSNYYLDYDKDRNSFRNRDDNAVSGYVFYKIFPKTAAFVEFKYVDINYDEDILTDSQEYQYFGGFRWKYSDKTSARVKIGYGNKDFDESGVDSTNDLIGEVQADYRYSEKTSFKLVATRQTNETDIVDNEYMLSHRVYVGYNQRLMPRLEGNAFFSFTRDSYRGTSDVGDGDRRRDNYYRAGLGLGYTFRSWLVVGGGYRFTTRDSNDGGYDYDNNTFFLTITAAI